MEISRLRRDHDRRQFDSGAADLDEFLRRFARQNDERDLSRTYVATQPGERQVLGFVTIRVGQVACSDLPEKERQHLPRYPVPVVHVERLAVDRQAQGAGLGETLLIFVLRKALHAADTVGIGGVEVIARNEQARGVCMRYGFEPLSDDRMHLYLSLGRVRRALA